MVGEMLQDEFNGIAQWTGQYHPDILHGRVTLGRLRSKHLSSACKGRALTANCWEKPEGYRHGASTTGHDAHLCAQLFADKVPPADPACSDCTVTVQLSFLAETPQLRRRKSPMQPETQLHPRAVVWPRDISSRVTPNRSSDDLIR